MAFRLRGDSASARALPPFAPPSFPSATAAGFFPLFGSSSGSPVNFSPIACSTTRRATVAKSWSVPLLERVGMILLCQDGARTLRTLALAVAYRQQRIVWFVGVGLIVLGHLAGA